ncbi:MAG: cupin domain-containing protein [Chthoniobacterales bacterium]
MVPGIRRRTLTNGPHMYQMMAQLDAGSVMPSHHHPQEQILHVLRGKLRLILDGKTREMATGDSYYLGSNVSHGVETIEESLVLDTFSPPRDDYLAIDAKQSS